jgi:hypothetical protein
MSQWRSTLPRDNCVLSEKIITDERDQRQALQQVQQCRKDQRSQMDLELVISMGRD